MTQINLDPNAVEISEEMEAILILKSVLYEVGVTAEHITNQLNQMGDMIFKQTKCNPQLIFNNAGIGGLKLIQLLDILKTALSTYDAEKYVVNPAPMNMTNGGDRVLLTEKVPVTPTE